MPVFALLRRGVLARSCRTRGAAVAAVVGTRALQAAMRVVHDGHCSSDAATAAHDTTTDGAETTTTTTARAPGEAAAVTTSASFYDDYVPIDCGALPYESGIAAQLRAAAARRGYVERVWATRSRYASLGVDVVASCDDAVAVRLADGAAVVHLYNVAQTNHAALVKANAPAAAAVGRVSAAALPYAGARRVTTAWWEAVPRDLVGRRLTPRVRLQLSAHPRFAERLRSSPVWVSLLDIHLLHLHVREDERGGGVALPSYTRWRDDWHDVNGDTAAARQRCIDDDREAVMRLYGDYMPEVDLRTHSLYYHMTQLIEEPQLREELRGYDADRGDRECKNGDGGFYATSLYGGRYSVVNAYLLRRYCRNHGLPTAGVAVFVTPRQLRQMGGRVLAAAGATPADAQRDDGDGEDSNSVATAATPAMPQPAVLLVHGDIVSLYHASQTSIAQLLLDRMNSMQKARIAETTVAPA